jgi:hypothetical protein
MRRHSIPNDIVIKAVAVFREGERSSDRAAHNASSTFFQKIEEGLLTPAKARKFLDNSEKVASLIKEEREIAADLEMNINASIVLENNARLARLEQQFSDQLGALKSLDDKHTQSVTTLAKNTDPVANNKSSFWINIRAGAIYFIAGLIASPMASIFFKKPMDDLDKWYNGADKPAITQGAPPDAVQLPASPVMEKPKTTAVADPRPTTLSPVPLALGPAGLYDPATGKAPNLLDTSRRFSIIVKKPAAACQRPVPPIVCQPQAIQQPR